MSMSPEAREECERIIARYPSRRSAMLPVLWIAQREYGYITEEAMKEVAEILGVRPVEVADVVSFYFMFRDKPVGRHIISVCGTLSCALLGSRMLLKHLEEKLGIRAGQTTPDGMFTLEVVECIGACADAPCVAVDYYHQYKCTPEKLDDLIERLRKGEEPQQDRRNFEDWKLPEGALVDPVPPGWVPPSSGKLEEKKEG